MNAQEIKQAVDNGHTVCWGNDGYRVIKTNGVYLIWHHDGHAIGLTHRDGISLNGKESEFFISDNLSEEGRKIARWMLQELSQLKYGNRVVVEGCFDAAIDNYAFVAPPESKSIIVDKTLRMLNGEYNETD